MADLNDWTKDEIVLSFAGENIARRLIAYRVEQSVFRAPGAFTARIGYDGAVKDALGLKQLGRINSEFRLALRRIDPEDFGSHDRDIPLQTGRIDSWDYDSSGPTEIEYLGRDMIAPLFDHYFIADRSFSESSYYDITVAAMKLVGLDPAILVTGAGAYDKAVSGYQNGKKSKAEPLDASTQIVEQTEGGKTRLVYNTIKADIGNQLYGWLKEQYKRSGLFLWASPTGKLILSQPNGTLLPSYRLIRRKGSTRAECNILHFKIHPDYAEQHSHVHVYGRAGGGKDGKRRIHAVFEDAKMVEWGFKKSISYEEDVRTQKEAEYLAYRYAAEERRRGFSIEVTVSGHTAPDANDPSQRLPWQIDSTVEVDDEITGLSGTLYIGDVSFERSQGSGTQTKLKLYRPGDLVFADPRSKS